VIRKNLFLPLLTIGLGLAWLASHARATDSLPHLVLPSAPVQASDDFQWSIPVRVVNGTDQGIYLDSLHIVIKDDYAGSRRRGQTWTFNVTSFTKILRSVSAHDSGQVTYQGPSYAEIANVTMRLHCHTGDGTMLTTPDATVQMAPSSISSRHPPLFLQTKNGRVEYSLVPELWPGRRSPGVLLIHGEDAQARDWLPVAWYVANHGFSCMLMSLPGYGLSEGPADFAGPRSVAAVNQVLDLLRRGPNIDSTRLAIWGISEGATVAAIVAAKRKDVGAVVLQSGLYDLADAMRTSQSKEFQRILETEAGPKSGWKNRSPLLAQVRPAAPTLVLHGGDDRVVPVEQAKAYHALVNAKGGRARLEVFPLDGHRLHYGVSRDTVLSFLRAHVSPSAGQP
jgi:pimeloyl-ACP methyl ester carboxylesterase